MLCKACQNIFLGHRTIARLLNGDELDSNNESGVETESGDEQDSNNESEVETESGDELDPSNESQAETEGEASAAYPRPSPSAKRSTQKKRSYRKLLSHEELAPTSPVQSHTSAHRSSKRVKRRNHKDHTSSDSLLSTLNSDSEVPLLSPSPNAREPHTSAHETNPSNEFRAEERSKVELDPNDEPQAEGSKDELDPNDESQAEGSKDESDPNDESQAEEGREDEIGPRDVSRPPDEPFLVNNPIRGRLIPQYIHHKSGRAFLKAGRIGCQLCLMFLNQLTQKDHRRLARKPQKINPESDPADYVTTYFIGGEVGFGEGKKLTNAEWSIMGRYGYPSRGSERTIRYQVAFTGAEQAPLPTYKVSKFVGSDDIAFSLTQDWIKTCDEEHKHCSRRSLSYGQNSRIPDVDGFQPFRSMDSNMPNLAHQKSPSRSPSPSWAFARIIDIGGTHDFSEPRLREAEYVPTNALYVTLSHCWGAFQPLTLTEATYEAMKECIPLKDLPQTFADAICVTRKLRIRFLWIDSLCIIQNSRQDWIKQSAVMGDIYGGSYCNIAATAAKNSHEGLFFQRDPNSFHLHPDSIPPLRVFLPQPSRVVTILSTPGAPQYYDAVDRKMWTREVSKSPLCLRSWVVQERALTRRSLHFSKRQLYWECSQLSACETIVGGLEHFGAVGGHPLYFKTYDPLRADLPTTLSSLESGVGTAPRDPPPFLSVWGKLVEIYTEARLTRDTDKLVAISGLAKVMGERAHIRYLAGLWDYNLPAQLRWRTLKPEPRPSYYRAPSWSWASIDSPIIPGVHALERTRIGVIDVQITTSESHSFSEFGSGHLRIRGDLLPGVLTSRNAPDGGVLYHYLSVRDLIKSSVFLDTQENNCGLVFCAPIEYDPRTPSNEQSGLILKATGTKGVFRRIGFFHLWCPIDYDRGSDRNIRLMDPTPSPSTIDPRSEVDEQFYHSYIDIEDEPIRGGGHRYLGNFIFDII